MIWLTADEHYGHTNVISFCGRPFSSIEEMDEALIARHNAVVQPGDTVYHLGDFAWKDALTYLRRLRGCEHILVLGNHDHKHLKPHEKECFDRVVDVCKINFNHQSLWASHYPHARWPGSHKGRCHVFGHSHGKFPGIGRSTDVGVDSWNFYPVRYDDIYAYLLSKPPMGTEEKA